MIRLLPEDPTIFASCPRCTRTGVGSRTKFIYQSAFNRRKWARKPVCPNCKTRLVKLYEVK